MSGPKIRFYLDGFLKNWEYSTFLRRNANKQIIDENDAIFNPIVSEAPVVNGFSIDKTDPDEYLVYYDDILMFKFDPVIGNIIYSIDDLNVLPVDKGGTGVETVAEIIELLNLKSAAFKDTGILAGQVVVLGVDGKLPALNAELLTNLPTFPSGFVQYFANETAPTGYLECNGALLLRASYPALFAAIGTKWGAGDGATTFRIPDLRGVFLRGWDHGRGLDPLRLFGDLQMDAIRNITGSMRGIGRGSSLGGDGAFTPTSTSLAGRTSTGNTEVGFTFNASKVVPVADENRPVNVTLLPCIKY